MNSLVTIIMATYNRAHLIGETLESLMHLDYFNWECLVIDDGSTDETEKIVKSFCNRDNRFVYAHRPDQYQKGLPGCRNYGLDTARGEYILFVDDDDLVNPRLLSFPMQALFEHPNADFCHYPKRTFSSGNKVIFDTDSLAFEREITKQNINEVITNKLLLASCTLMWRKSSIGNERFEESLQFAEEWEFYTRLITNGKRGIMIRNTLYHNRKHAASNTGEYWTSNPKRVESKLTALLMLSKQLTKHQLMNQSILEYLLGILVQHKAWRYVRKMSTITNKSELTMYFLYFKILTYRLALGKTTS